MGHYASEMKSGKDEKTYQCKKCFTNFYDKKEMKECCQSKGQN